jgi:D-glycero-D-manno-heptose 1,7-bisphosphate phosphatase
MNKALFLDRDGTIIYDKSYLSDPAQVTLIPGVANSLQKAIDLGYILFLYTNQSGINRGYFKLEDALKVNERVEEVLGLPRPVFKETCIAPERPDEPHVYRKPSPKFVLEMIEKYDLDPEHCYVVGDTLSDIMAGINAGITSIAVETGEMTPPKEIPEVNEHNVAVFPSLREFVQWLEEKEQ